MRGSRKRWTQGEGLAIFRVVDALVPGRQARVFTDKPASTVELLAAAAGR